MDELIIPAQQRNPNDYEKKDDDSTCAHEDGSITYSNNDFDLPISSIDDFRKAPLPCISTLEKYWKQ